MTPKAEATYKLCILVTFRYSLQVHRIFPPRRPRHRVQRRRLLSQVRQCGARSREVRSGDSTESLGAAQLCVTPVVLRAHADMEVNGGLLSAIGEFLLSIAHTHARARSIGCFGDRIGDVLIKTNETE